MPDWIRTILFIIGYLFLAGPPRAVEIMEHANRTQGELMGKPLWLIMLVEFMTRGGLFLLMVVGLESVIGDLLYERFRIDMFMMVLIVSGFIHSLFYYCTFQLLKRNWTRLAIFCYRLGRNFTYAVIPAFFAAGGGLVWQELQQQELFEGDLVQMLFLGTWAGFLLAGLFESLLARRLPSGLGLLQQKLMASR